MSRFRYDKLSSHTNPAICPSLYFIMGKQLKKATLRTSSIDPEVNNEGTILDFKDSPSVKFESEMISGDSARRKLNNRRLTKEKAEIKNFRPIIGILTQELHKHLSQTYGYSNYKSYIGASYVKFIESAGARVVPIRIGEKFEYYEEIANSVNGILLPGGAAKLNVRGGYAEAGILLYYLAVERKLPIWGTCLGYELIMVVAADGMDLRQECQSKSVSIPIKFTKDAFHSRLFGSAPQEIIDILKSEDSVANHHSLCITVETLENHKLTKDWRVLSLNEDSSGNSYVSTIESIDYPIWGVQFHPEKSCFEWERNKYSHTPNAVKVTQYFANFFVNEARKNNNSFITKKREDEMLIYNYNPTYTGKKGSLHMQCYFFK